MSENPAIQPTDADLAEEYARIMADEPAPAPKKKGRPSARELLRKVAEDAGLRLGIDQNVAFVQFYSAPYWKSSPIRSHLFTMHLRVLAHNKNIAVSKNAIDEAVSSFEAQAYSENTKIQTAVRAARVARVDRVGNTLMCDYVMVDPGRDDYKVLVMAGEGYKLVGASAPFVPWFHRPAGFAALPDAVSGGNISDLFSFVNIRKADELLVLAFMIHAWRPGVPSPVLQLTGEQGSAKTDTAKTIKYFVDANSAPMIALPRDPDEFFILAETERLLCFDNVSHLDAEQADALAMLATGAARKRRKLYSDADVSIVKAQGPVILTSIADLIVRGDLAERAVVIECPRISGDSRRTETDLAAELAKAAPYIFGAFLDCVDATVATLPSVQLEKRKRSRLADFSDTGEALARVLGYEPGTFDELLAENQNKANDVLLDSSVLARSLIELVRQRGPMTASPAVFYNTLSNIAGERETHAQSWPRTPAALSTAIRRLAPALRLAGLEVDAGRNHDGRYIAVQQRGKTDTRDTERRERLPFGDDEAHA